MLNKSFSQKKSLVTFFPFDESFSFLVIGKELSEKNMTAPKILSIEDLPKN